MGRAAFARNDGFSGGQRRVGRNFRRPDGGIDADVDAGWLGLLAVRFGCPRIPREGGGEFPLGPLGVFVVSFFHGLSRYTVRPLDQNRDLPNVYSAKMRTSGGGSSGASAESRDWQKR